MTITPDTSRIGTNQGHGHAWPRPDGMKARCGGPGLCQQCAADQALVDASATRCTSCDHLLTDHDDTGCWWTLSVGTPGKDLVCPCSVTP